MRYLVISKRYSTYHYAKLYTSENVLYETFNTIAENLDIITNDNINTYTLGKIVGDNIEDIEPLMRELGFCKCDICGAWVNPQDRHTGASTYIGGKRYCPQCEAIRQTTAPKTTKLYGYHSTSEWNRVVNAENEDYTLDNVLGIGFETEGYNGHYSLEEIKVTNDFEKLINRRSQRNFMFRCERDGSVSYEIISNTFTKKALYAFDFNILTDMQKLNGNIEGNTQAGLHVHLSKLWLGDTPKEQCLNFLKLQYFLKMYESDFLTLCGRKADNMYYCQFFSNSEIENMKYYVLNNDNPWRYMPCSHGGCGCSLNASSNTIEWRIGSNTNDPVRMRNYILFLLGITENIRHVSWEKLWCLRKVTKLVPNEIMDYWRNKGCFLTTRATTSRGMTLSV